MKYFILLSLAALLVTCSNHDPLKTAIHTEVTKIMTKDISTTGKILEPVKIADLEVEKVSMKEYFSYEWKQQDSQFKKFVDQVGKLKTGFDLSQSLNTHDSVMSYLASAVKTASEKPEVYKVDYSLTAATRTAKYNRHQVIFLDSSLKKIEPDYSFLKRQSD